MSLGGYYTQTGELSTRWHCNRNLNSKIYSTKNLDRDEQDLLPERIFTRNVWGKQNIPGSPDVRVQVMCGLDESMCCIANKSLGQPTLWRLKLPLACFDETLHCLLIGETRRMWDPWAWEKMYSVAREGAGCSKGYRRSCTEENLLAADTDAEES